MSLMICTGRQRLVQIIRRPVRLVRVDKSALRVDTSRQYWTTLGWSSCVGSKLQGLTAICTRFILGTVSCNAACSDGSLSRLHNFHFTHRRLSRNALLCYTFGCTNSYLLLRCNSPRFQAVWSATSRSGACDKYHQCPRPSFVDQQSRGLCAIRVGLFSAQR